MACTYRWREQGVALRGWHGEAALAAIPSHTRGNLGRAIGVNYQIWKQPNKATTKYGNSLIGQLPNKETAQ